MFRRARTDTAAVLMFLAPSALGFMMFYLIPFAMGVYDSFVESTADNRFVGFEHYRELLSSESFRKAARNTASFTLVSVPLMILLSLSLAVLLNQNIYIRRWLRTAFVLPLVVPAASVVLVWQILLDWNGSVNAWLGYFERARVDWMKTDAARSVVIAVYLWKNIGYNMILFLAGLQQIPKDYYETARIEGAGPFRQFRSITLVYLTSTLFFVTIMSVINSFKVFRETYLIAGDYPHDSIYMLQHYMNNMFMSLDIPKLTAAATLMTGSILLLVLVLFALERRFRSFLE
ncbi:sugar ABC transporter permease [Paenibacillus chitinolyticus]|uniref:Sugar ABC transporter permease n=1 Tax=Paenibacillus chitinolyticus TaxID=79263 RepID=A0A410X3Y3_9BACL|nr:sugar ABC transporter permease [Paenibacillus chitinolyticus]MCY9593332.1 sugar ABC transporter permease [Paenibacillus chitinolyticus]MCY9599879.1 sugar ABC transporter permease [Paenibacillus chitinolyticus]QAV21343.1 sugar ABC transporter permease [Paenibacillus chitinolyticus]